MNGKCAKRIRVASLISGFSTSQLKAEYKKLPYHRRNIVGVEIASHSEALKKQHRLTKQFKREAQLLNV